jgi:hypothetical protein
MKTNDFLKIGFGLFSIFFLGNFGIKVGPLYFNQLLGGFAILYVLLDVINRNRKKDTNTPFDRSSMNLKLLQIPIIFIFVGLYFAYNSPLPAKIYYGFPLNKMIGFGIVALQVLIMIKYLTQSKK